MVNGLLIYSGIMRRMCSSQLNIDVDSRAIKEVCNDNLCDQWFW